MLKVEEFDKCTIFYIKPYRNWFLIIFFILFLPVTTLFLIVYSLMIYFEKQYYFIPLILIKMGIIVFILRKLIWTFKGEIQLEIDNNKIVIQKKGISNKFKSYFLDEIENVSIENLYEFRMLKNIPLLGEFYLSLVNYLKKDSESIFIKYRQQHIQILSRITKDNAILIESKLKEYLTK